MLVLYGIFLPPQSSSLFDSLHAAKRLQKKYSAERDLDVTAKLEDH